MFSSICHFCVFPIFCNANIKILITVISMLNIVQSLFLFLTPVNYILSKTNDIKMYQTTLLLTHPIILWGSLPYFLLLSQENNLCSRDLVVIIMQCSGNVMVITHVIITTLYIKITIS